MSQGKRQRRGIIYLIHCIPENKDYVGQTRRSFKKRWHEHCHAVEKYGQRLAEGKRTSLSSIDEKINELGPDAFETSILERPLIKDLNKQERYWIAELGTRDPHGYNKTDGGGANGRIEWAEEDLDNMQNNPNHNFFCNKVLWSYSFLFVIFFSFLPKRVFDRMEVIRMTGIRKKVRSHLSSTR